jgi:hypothetical protein
MHIIYDLLLHLLVQFTHREHPFGSLPPHTTATIVVVQGSLIFNFLKR